MKRGRTTGITVPRCGVYGCRILTSPTLSVESDPPRFSALVSQAELKSARPLPLIHDRDGVHLCSLEFVFTAPPHFDAHLGFAAFLDQAFSGLLGQRDPETGLDRQRANLRRSGLLEELLE